MKLKQYSLKKCYKILIISLVCSFILFFQVFAQQIQFPENNKYIEKQKNIYSAPENNTYSEKQNSTYSRFKRSQELEDKEDKFKDQKQYGQSKKSNIDVSQERIDKNDQKTRFKPFGYNFFEAARKNIRRIEQSILNRNSFGISVNDPFQSAPSSGSINQGSSGSINQESPGSINQRSLMSSQQNAISSFVGPMEMVSNSVYTTIPKRYNLSPNDIIKLSFWGKLTEFKELSLVIDKHGFLTIPKGGKLVANGMTLFQLQENIKKLLRRSLDKNLEVIVTLGRLKSIQISITGEAVRPGSYAVSASTTLFNALYACGGLSEKGSLRNIRLLRNQKTIHVDFYQYLLYGENHDDIPLQSGDNIFIPRSKRNISLEGEVNRPGLYELKDGENLVDLLKIAGGIKPSGIFDQVQIQSVSLNKKRMIFDVNLKTDLKKQVLILHDGDIVTIFPVLSEIKNIVYLQGAVERPGKYELKENMRIADLFSEINNPDEDVFWDRADIMRYEDKGKTTFLIPVNLKKALNNHSEHNIKLKKLDKIIVYSKWDVKYISPHIVKIFGSVQRPDEYTRTEGMKLKTLIFQAGGLLPGYYNNIELVRYKNKSSERIIEIDIDRLLKGDDSQNILLEDEDIVMIKKDSNFFTKPLLVTIGGEVLYPGTYALKTRDDHISDIVSRAGGLTHLADPKGTIFKRKIKNTSSTDTLLDISYVNSLVNQINMLEYQQQVTRNEYLWTLETGDKSQKPVFPNIAAAIASSDASEESIAKAMIAPSLAESSSQIAGSTFDAIKDTPSVVGIPRRLSLEELLPSKRIIFDMINALSDTNDNDNSRLYDGDTLFIPQKPTTVSVIGAVLRPSVITSGKKGISSEHSIQEYINLAGGYTADSNIEKVVVFRRDGSILANEKVKAVEVGDVIYVPTRSIAKEIVTTTDKILDTIKYAVVTLTGYMALIAILAL